TVSNSRSRAARSSGSFTTRPCTALKVRAASALLPTLFPSPTGSRLSPSSSQGAIHDMAQTGRSNVRYVDPQRRYTVVLGPSWNAPFGALPHDDRAGTHDSVDGRCGSYVSIGCGQAALWITAKKFCGFAALRDSRRLLIAAGQRVAETLSERGELSGDEVDAPLGAPVGRRRAAEQRDELASFHVDFALALIASSASACHPASLSFIRATSVILPSATMRSACADASPARTSSISSSAVNPFANISASVRRAAQGRGDGRA